jgi:hypothetical protein
MVSATTYIDSAAPPAVAHCIGAYAPRRMQANPEKSPELLLNCKLEYLFCSERFLYAQVLK